VPAMGLSTRGAASTRHSTGSALRDSLICGLLMFMFGMYELPDGPNYESGSASACYFQVPVRSACCSATATPVAGLWFNAHPKDFQMAILSSVRAAKDNISEFV
jgi:hypothetical protein